MRTVNLHHIVSSTLHRSLCSAVLFAIAAVAFLVPVSARAATDRITAPIAESQIVQLKGNVNGRVQSSQDQGRLASNVQINGIRIVFQPSVAQQVDLDSLLVSLNDPNSPLYHQWLTPAQYASRFGLSANDIQAVTIWLQSQGLTVNSVSPAGNAVIVSGTTVQVENAFRTELHSYLFNGETHFANSTSPSLPAAIAGMTAGILGLDDFLPHPKSVQANASLAGISPKFTSSESGDHFITPGDFSTIYNVGPLYTANFHGEGRKIALVGQTAIYTGDITAYRSAANLPALTVPANAPSSSQYVTSATSCSAANASLCLVCVSSNTSECTTVSGTDLPEADLDIELSSAVAYNGQFLYVYDPTTNNGVFNAYDYAIEHDVAPIVSISYGECEDYTGSVAKNESLATAFRVYTQEGNTQGQTTIAAAGDDGAADCDYTSGSTADDSARQGLQVDIPADIPEVTAMGGSEFYPDAEATCTSGACTTNGSANNTTPSVYSTTTYWTGTASSADVLSSALSYIPEVVWNDNSLSVAAYDGFSAGGGGISHIFSKPTWQTALTVSADTASGAVATQRDVPDLTLSASPYHDPYLVCTQVLSNGGSGEGSSCTSGFRYGSDGDLTAYGGTSVAAPSFAGILALMEQRNNTTYGNVNTLLYDLAGGSSSYASAFHDIAPVASGSILFGANNNDDPCTTGTQNCTTGTLGYTTLVGYDLASGLGSVNAANLASTANSLTPSTTAISYSPTTVTTATPTVTITATVASGSTSVTTTPTGTVTFTINGVAGSPINLSGGTASTTASFPSGGTQTIIATYSGSSTYIGSTDTSTIPVAASGLASTSVSVTANPTSVEIGQSFTLNSTVSSAVTGSITGTVTYTLGSYVLGTANVTATTGTTGTAAQLTVVASTQAGFSTGTTNTITATYNGNSAYATSTNTTPVSVSAVPSFTVTATPMTISSTANGSVGTSTITVTAVNGYSGTVFTPCTNATQNNINISPNTLDLYFYCAASTTSTTTYSQVTVNSSAPATFPLTFQLNTAAGAAVPGTGSLKRAPVQSSKLAIFGGTAALAGLFFFSFSGLRRRKLPILLCLLVFGFGFAGMGCGSSTNNNSNNNSGSTINTAGTYTVTVIMQDTNNLTAQGTFTLTIQ